MTEKEAREIIKDTVSNGEHMFFKAKGYLEALEKAKVLEAALKEIMDSDALPMAYATEKGEVRDIVEEALAQWEKEK